jgi:GH15 family glucan-1,4-alpha-glucosidase
MNTNNYPPIDQYGFIADCHSAALVSRTGAIDWCCMPRIDSSSCFGRILDWKKGGYCRIAPASHYESERRYLDRTLVLENTFQTETGRARLIDCFTMRRGGEYDPHRQILRVIEDLRGNVEFRLDVVPRFDYGAIKPWIRCYRQDHHIAIGGCDGLLVSGDVPVTMKHHHAMTATFTVGAGQRRRLSILHRPPEILDENLVDVPDPDELDRRLQETIEWWQNWSDQGQCSKPYADQLQRSAIVLKGLFNAPLRWATTWAS